MKDVDELKRTTPQRTARPFGAGSVQSTSRTQSVMQSGNSDDVVPILSWAERMELEDEQRDEDSLEPVDGDGRDSREQPVKSDKVALTTVNQPTEDFLRQAFTPMTNVTRRKLRSEFIVPDTTFTTAPWLDKSMKEDCSKSVRSSDSQLSEIQAHFLDAVGPLTGMLESINSGSVLNIEDVEQAVRAALSFLGNASSRCTSQRRLGILSEYNRDLVSFATESNELFSSATTTLFGPSFPEKAAAHIKQMQTLRNSRLPANPPKSQGFSKAPSYPTQRGSKYSYKVQRRHQPYPRGGKGRGGSSQRTSGK